MQRINGFAVELLRISAAGLREHRIACIADVSPAPKTSRSRGPRVLCGEVCGSNRVEMRALGRPAGMPESIGLCVDATTSRGG